jgi:hypothetical protein
MHADQLFDHALSILPEAVSDLLREGRSPTEYVFASFDGASELGIALIASDLASELGVAGSSARNEVMRMIAAANHRGEELVVSLMVTKDVLLRILAASNVDAPTRIAVQLWLDGPLAAHHFRVVAIANEHVRAAAVDGATDIEEEAPVSSSMLN